MRQESIMIMIRDEIGLIPMQMSSGEGNPLKVSDGRTVAFDETGRVKILDYSTPGLSGYCLIEMQYNKGDKRKYRVKCPLCGKRQHLGMGDEKSNWGLKGDYKAGKLINAHYLCFHCNDAIFNHQKIEMIETGIWEPTSTPIAKDFRSYIFPAFYSPMLNWLTIRKEYDEAINEGDNGMRSFTNLYLAKPFEPTGEQPEFKSVIEIRSKYKSGEVPPGILYLTMFVDVQRGMDKFKDYTQEEITAYAKKHKNNHVRLQELPRLEAEVMGHGAQFRTASIIWNTIYGQINNYTLGSWDQLREWIEPGLIFKRKDGFEFPVQTIFIDSGDGMYSDLVYNFCSPKPSVYASKGAATPKKDKLKLVNIDSMVAGNIYNFKLSKQANGQNIILINTNYYKGAIYRLLKNVSPGSDNQIPNSHITPADYPDYYFQQLRAEKQKTDGTFHNPANKRNEALDSLVGNKAESDFIIQGFIEADREKLKREFPALRAKTREADEKLRELVNRETVTRSIIEELIKMGWGKDDS
jgi:phage terminase large subunit GpA-like protein